MGKAAQLAEKVDEKIQSLVQGKLDSVKAQLDSFAESGESGEQSTNIDFLCFFRDFWISFCMQMQAFRDVFLVLERTYLL